MPLKVIFGGVIACVLLGLYVYLILVAIMVAVGATAPAVFTANMGSTLTLIGGLVSALVIAELGVTKPGAPLLAHLLPAKPPDEVRSRLATISVVYLLVWGVSGLAAFVIGYLQHPELKVLADLGQSWLGLAVAAAYAYFGITPA